MAETRRSLTQFNSNTTGLFKDNAVGLISEQDLRDFVYSTAFPVGVLSISSSASTTISSSGVYVQEASTWALDGAVRDFDMNTNAQLRYTDAPDVLAFFVAVLSGQHDGIGTKDVSIRVAKNGTTLAATQQGIKFKASENLQITTFGLVSLAQNDYLSLFVANDSDTTNVTMVTGHISAVGLFK